MPPPPTNDPAAPPIDRHRWFAEEIHAHEPQLKSFLRGAFPSIRDVDDVIQESYLRLWRRHVASPLRSARTFLYTIARHLAIDALRHHDRSPFVEVADSTRLAVLEDRPDAAEAACTSDELDLLVEAIEALPPRCREIVILRKLRGLSQKEIARQLGITERTVEVQGTKGLDRCERFLRARGLNRNRR